MPADRRAGPAAVVTETGRKHWLGRMRAGEWLHFLVLPAAAWPPPPSMPDRVAMLAVLRGVAVAFGVLAFGYLLNASADRQMDDPSKNPLDASGADRFAVRHAATAAAVLALALAASGGWIPFSAAVVCVLSGTLYSVGPRLKAYPGVGTLLNATSFAPLLLVGLPPHAGPAGMAPLGIAFVALLLQNQLLHEAADAAEDARGGIATTVRVVGPSGSAAAAAGLGAVATAAAAWCTAPWVAMLSAVLTVGAFPALLLRRGHDPHAMRRPRRWHRLTAIALGALLFFLRRG